MNSNSLHTKDIIIIIILIEKPDLFKEFKVKAITGGENELKKFSTFSTISISLGERIEFPLSVTRVGET